GAIAPVPVVWDLVDFASAFMVFFNVIALVGLSKYVAFALKDYAKQWSNPKPGEDRPVWDYEHQIGPEDVE
ncbi:MAG: alanine:cation symporter family protein, partial [Acidaminococcus sp.]|nr:alanine:cation symporter family protein [Acidaminococcus sp.]